MTGPLCPICGKSLDNAHIFEWTGKYWQIVCPKPLIVEKPLAHCRLDGVEAKDG